MTIHNTQKTVGRVLKIHPNFFPILSGYPYAGEYMQISRGKNAISEIKLYYSIYTLYRIYRLGPVEETISEFEGIENMQSKL